MFKGQVEVTGTDPCKREAEQQRPGTLQSSLDVGGVPGGVRNRLGHWAQVTSVPSELGTS